MKECRKAQIARKPKTDRCQLRRDAREKAGLSVRDAARRAFVNPTTIEGYEKGRTVPFHRAELLSRACNNCPLEIFL